MKEIMQDNISSNPAFRTRLTKFDGITARSKHVNGRKIWDRWEIDESQIDWHKINTELAPLYPEEIKKLKAQLEPTQCTFSTLWDDIFNQSPEWLKNHTYSITCDIYRTRKIKDARMYTVYDNMDSRYTFQVYAPPHIVDEIENPELHEKRVTITGKVSLYKDNQNTNQAMIQLIADSIQEIGDCLRLQQTKEWRPCCERFFQTEEEQKEFYDNFQFRFNNIIVITNEDSEGFADFKKILGNIPEQSNIQIDVHGITMSKENLIKEINIIKNDEYGDDTDCICILRGGGNPDDLQMYNDPELVKVIASSNIPIITGIGHTKNVSFCDQAAAYNAGTPSHTADQLKKKMNPEKKYQPSSKQKQKNQQKQSIAEQDKINQQQQIMQLKYEKQTLIDDLKEANNRIKYLEQQLQYAQTKNTGFFSRLFK